MPREAEIRRDIIDKRLEQAGWSVERGNLIREFFLPGTTKQLKEQDSEYFVDATAAEKISQDGIGSQGEDEFVDYVLLGQDDKPRAIVEAKRDARSPLEGKRQAEDYAEHIYEQTGVRPFIFLSNGDQTIFLDKGRYPEREVSGFFSPDDLERIDLLRQYSQPLHLFSPASTIVDRDYQVQAIGAVIDRIKLKKRKFLLVMATGTGKTRTIIALVDLLMRAGWVRRVLFLADRRELVKQAQGAFREHMPQESQVRIEGGTIRNSKARIHFATYPSMVQVCKQLSVGYYDLIIADESHRSIYKRYKEIFTHFDAMQVGLTATPTYYIDHNTYELFDCVDDLPTFEYAFETAVEDKYLVDFKVLEAQTRFQIEGIKAGELPPEFLRQIEEQGLDASEINFEGSDLERKVTNTGTNDQLVDEFVEHSRKDVRGLPAKSIIFAVSHNHALELLGSFNRRYPDYQARGLAQVIDSRMERHEKTLEDFKSKNMPRVAISVDMLDTGIDIPAIQTLVFAKPVYSRVKFWQMIGRGTRLWEDPVTKQQKADFLIIDHWGNFEYFDKNAEGEVSNPSEPLPVRLFRVRLRKLEELRQNERQSQRDEAEMIGETLAQLHSMLEELPDDNAQVKPHATLLATLRIDADWEEQDIRQQGEIYRVIAPLMRFLPGVDAYSMLFELHTEELALALLERREEWIKRLREQIEDELEELPPELPEVKSKEAMRARMASPNFWTDLDMQRILELQKELSPLMRYRQTKSRAIVKLRLPDTIKTRRWVIYGPSGEGAFVDHYRGQVEAHIKDLAEQEPVLAKVQQRKEVSGEEIQALTDVLNRPDLFIREEILQQVYENPEMRLIDFVRGILEGQALPSREARIKTAVQEYINAHPRLTVAQRNFIYALRSVLVRQNEGQVTLTQNSFALAPFNRVGRAEDLFSAQELADLLQFANRVA